MVFYFCSGAPLKINRFLAFFYLTPILSKIILFQILFFNILIKLSLKKVIIYFFEFYFYNICLNNFFRKIPNLHDFRFFGAWFYCKNIIFR